MVGNMEAYLKRVNKECSLTLLEDLYELYSFIPNDDLRSLCAKYHLEINRWFAIINSDLRYGVDDDGVRHCIGGHFHAQDSRDYLDFLNNLDKLISNLKGADLALRICNDDYRKAINTTRLFVVPSGGSSIPEDYEALQLTEVSPIFKIANSRAIDVGDCKISVPQHRLPSGSYANVYWYQDPVYDVPVVVKKANEDLTPKELERFKLEFETLKNLNSPYIVKVFAYDDQSHEYTMEKLDETISNYIGKFIGPKKKELSFHKRKNLINQICHGLSYIHSKGLLHRDISFTNIFVNHYDDVDVVKIADFGLVKDSRSTLTSSASSIKGSLNDPDLINVGFKNYEIRHETYALTRLCAFILCGSATLEGFNDGKLKDFWRKGTNTNIEERFRNVDEVCQAVKYLTEEDIDKGMPQYGF